MNILVIFEAIKQRVLEKEEKKREEKNAILDVE
jgi:hypothetical protein